MIDKNLIILSEVKILTKKFITNELELLDENGCKKIKLTPLKEDVIPSLIDKDEIRGGYGNIKAKGGNT